MSITARSGGSTGPGTESQSNVVEEPLSADEIRAAGLKGIRWSLIARPVVEVVLLCSMVVLARLVSPEDFGRYAVALVFGELMLIPGQGVGAALVQRQTTGPRYLQTGVALSVITCMTIAAVSWVLAGLIIKPIFDARTAELVRLSTVACLLNATNIVPMAVLQRQLAFRRLSILDVTNTVVRVAACLSFAIIGWGAVGLVLGGIVGGVASTILLMIWAFPPLPRFHRAEARDLSSYGAPAALAAMSWVGFRNCDYAIVGARLGPLQAGYYFRAYTLGVEYQSKVGLLMNSVGFPLIARANRGEEQAELRRRMVRLLTLVLFPALVLLAIVGPRFIPWLFGSEWTPVVVPTQILVVGGAVTLVINAVGTVLMAQGRTRAMLGYGWSHFATYAAVVVVVSPLGIAAVAAGAAVVHSLFLVVAYALLCARGGRGVFRWLAHVLRELWSDIAPATVPSLAFVMVAIPISKLDAAGNLPIIGYLTMVSAAGFAAYLTAMRLLYPAALHSLVNLFRHLLPESFAPRFARRTPSASPQSAS